MFCTYCGAENDDDAAFCTSCGEPMLDDEPESAALDPAVPEATPEELSLEDFDPETEVLVTLIAEEDDDFFEDDLAPDASSDETPSRKKSKKPLMIAIIVLIVLVIGGFAAYAALAGGGGAQDDARVENIDAMLDKERQALEDSDAQSDEAAALSGQNPASESASNEAAMLKGTLVRQVRTTEETGMGWASVDYMLVFDTPVTITYRSMTGGSKTGTFTQIQVDSKEVSIAEDPSVDANIDTLTIPQLQQYVGKNVAITGKIVNTENAHTFGEARFIGGYSISEL